ncbi:unnamed protein product, partial [Symbiodinium sp. CCMP2456]
VGTVSNRFVKHSDVQIILQGLGLPLIDLAYGQPPQTIEEDDREAEHNEHAIVPVEVVDVDAEPSVSTESTHGVASVQQRSGAQLVAAAAVGDAEDAPGGGGGDGILCRVERVPKDVWGRGRLPQKDLCTMTVKDFRAMTHARAAVVGAQACQSLAKATASLTQLRKVKRQVVAQATKTSKQLKLAQDSQSQTSSLELVVSKSGKRLTSESILALGIRRNLTHIAAADVGALLLRDLSGATVLRAEVRTGASVNACMKEFAENALAELRVPAADGDHDHGHGSDVDLADISYGGDWNLIFISVRADATNSNIWRREKLHVCEAHMGVVCKSVKSYPAHVEDFLRTKSDLQVVSGSTAEHCAGIMQKQLNSIGVPSVADLLADMDTEKPCGQGREDAAEIAIVLDDMKEHDTDSYRLKLSKWLVTMKLDEFNAEFSALFEKLPEIVDKALHLSGCFHETKGLSHADVVRMRYLALRLLMLHWAAFRRRIIRPLMQYPMKLFWLIKSHPKRYCARRQQVAQELLELDAHELDSATRKIKELCCRELQHMRITGVFPDVSSPSGSFLYAFLKGLARLLPADTQAIEGINSCIKLMGRRAPNMSLELMSSRLAIRRALSEDHSMARRKKWSAIKSTAEGLMQSIVGFKTASLAILSNENRWSVPLPTNCGNGVLPSVLAITDREAVLAVRGPEDQTGSAAASSAEAEAGRGQPEKSSLASLAADLAKAKATSGIQWAKSYNLAWRRATTSSAKKKIKQPDVGHRMGPGLLIAVIETLRKDTDGEGNDRLVPEQPPLFFAVAEKFSVSVMFSKIHSVQINGHQCLQWMYDENNCVESTLFFLSFHGACSCRGLHMRMGYTVLSPDMSHLLLPGWRSDAEGGGEIRVASVLPLVNHVFVMTAECHPSANPKSAKPQSGRKPKAKAAKRKPQEKQAGLKRKDAPEDDANEVDVDAPNVLDYIDDDENFLDDVEIATDAEDSDDDNTAKYEMHEISEANAAAATDPARLPSSKNVFAVAEDIHRNAELVPEAIVEEEALLLLVRRARSQKAKNMGVGVGPGVGVGRRGYILPGEESIQQQPHMSSQLPEESGALMDEASVASQRQPVDAEGVLGESDMRSGAEADNSASDNESDADLPPGVAAVLRSKAMVDLQRDGRVLKRWVMACHLMLQAMQEYAKTKDVLLGTERSISLVLLKSMGDAAAGCKCVRCKYTDDSQDLIWVHWLNNGRHGLVGRQGREVRLDDDGKVLFSVADCTMYRTGISNGIGYPELCLDGRHAHVMLPYVRAAMRKVKRTNPDRDAVSPHFLRLRDFCERMLTSVSQSTDLITDDDMQDEDMPTDSGIVRCMLCQRNGATRCLMDAMASADAGLVESIQKNK